MAKAKPRGRPWPKGRSGNPKGGRPKSDKTWGAIYAEVGAMTPAQAARRCHAIASQMAALGDGISLKEAVVMRVYSQLLFEPSGSLLDKVMERMEGRIIQPLEINWRSDIVTMLRDGDLTPKQVIAELGRDLAIELFHQAGIDVEVDD